VISKGFLNLWFEVKSKSKPVYRRRLLEESSGWHFFFITAETAIEVRNGTVRVMSE
jgi:hypothetical protein